MEREDYLRTCQEKLFFFRIKELKDVLGRLGIAKQGKKQILLERVLALLSDEQGSRSQGWTNKSISSKEEVARIIDDVYRKMQGGGATDLATRSRSPVICREVSAETAKETTVSCPCGLSMQNESLIQCDNIECQRWQHQRCVLITEDSVEGSPLEIPSSFYCQHCRVERGDPFCLTVSEPLRGCKLIASTMTVDGMGRLLTLEETFDLKRSDRDLLQKPGYELQVWCVLLNDKVPFRIHWPQYADLRVNGIGVRATTRQGTQLLGINARDDGPLIYSCSREGSNRISLQAQDNRCFVMGVRVLRRRKIFEVRNLIPSEADGETFELSVARVCRCIGGDDDGELQVVAASEVVSLRCPLSGSRIKVAGRFRACAHMGCFDLDSLIAFNQLARKWQCPTCLKNYSVHDIIIDPYFNRIVNFMLNYPEDVTEVEIKPDASWRPKPEGEVKNTERWHHPDGSILLPNGSVKCQPELKKVKTEMASEGHVASKIRMKRNPEGLWEVSGTIQSNGADTLYVDDINNSKSRLTTSSAGTTNRDEEDPSVNQEGSDGLDFSGTFDRYDSPSLGCNQIESSNLNVTRAENPKDQEVIILSDSDDEIMEDVNTVPPNNSAFPSSGTLGQGSSLLSNEALQETEPVDGIGVTFIPPSSAPLVVPYSEMIHSHPMNNATLGYFDGGNSDLNDLNIWSSQTQSRELRLFGENADISDTSQCASLACSLPLNDFGPSSLQPDQMAGEPAVPEYQTSLNPPSYDSTNTERNRGLNNSTTIVSEDAPLQCFLPLQPSRSFVQSDCRDPYAACEDLQTDWISLTLGNSNNNNSKKTCAENKMKTSENLQQSVGDGDDLATASVLLDMSENRADGCSGDDQGSDSPFLSHQRARSVRPRLCLPVDSESE